MLDAVSELAQDVAGDVRGTLGDEPDANALGTDETDYLLDLVHQGLGRALEEHMGFVEEEDQFREVHLPYLGQRGVQFRQQPQQEGGVELGLEHEFVGRQHVHDALAAFALQEVINVEIRLSEELLRPLVFQGE